jgi:hypothetical protein
MLGLTTVSRYENITLDICPLSEVGLMYTTFRKLTLLPSSGEINTVIIKPIVLGALGQADVGNRVTDVVHIT